MLDEMSAARRFAAEGESSRVVLGLWMLTVETLWENIIVLACASELSELAPRIFPTEGDFFHEVTLEYGKHLPCSSSMSSIVNLQARYN
jgi:hypothetical protein